VGFFGFGAIPGGFTAGSVLGHRGEFGPVFVPSTPASQWTFRPNTLANFISGGVAFGNGFYIVVGGSSLVNSPGLTGRSADGINWAAHPTPNMIRSFLTAVAFGNNVFLTGGLNTQVFRSIDNGLTWTLVGAPFGATDGVAALAYNGVLFCALATSGAYAISGDNGSTWTNPATITVQTWFNDTLIFDGAQFVAVGLQNVTGFSSIYTSPDGTTWTETVLDNTSTFTFASLCFTGTHYIVADVNSATVRRALTPAGLAVAANIATGLSTGATFNGNGLAAGGGRVVMATSDPVNSAASSTDDGLTWTAENLNYIDGDNATDVIFANGLFVAVGNDSNISTRTP
jgi:hypothetical protein